MKTYRVTVVRMVECEVLVEADSFNQARLKAERPSTRLATNDGVEVDCEIFGVEVVGEPEEVT